MERLPLLDRAEQLALDHGEVLALLVVDADARQDRRGLLKQGFRFGLPLQGLAEAAGDFDLGAPSRPNGPVLVGDDWVLMLDGRRQRLDPLAEREVGVGLDVVENVAGRRARL